MIDLIVSALQAFSAPGVFNPWRDVDPMDKYSRAPEQRASRLRAHFSINASYLLVGEAPGYQGCRFSGVPFTSEALLCEQRIPRIECARFTTRPRPWREPSATIVWGALHDLGIADDVVMWNAFPWHPHRPGEPYSNRRPAPAELARGREILEMVLHWCNGAVVVAVGDIAHEALLAHRKDVHKVRHPANGGATKFRDGMAKLIDTTKAGR